MQYQRVAEGCCGNYIAFNFGANHTAAAERELEALMAGREGDVRRRNPEHNVRRRDGQQVANVLTEAVLTDEQMRTWAPVLCRKGWRLVTRFLNSNTGNMVNVLHYSAKREFRRPADLPFEWRN
jgi:hypothetical protein